MSRFTTAFLITVIASSSLIAESGQDQHPPAIQGEVLDAGTQRPIANATITLLENGQQSDATTSGTEGIFDFAQSQEGVYQLLSKLRTINQQSQAKFVSYVTKLPFSLSSFNG